MSKPYYYNVIDKDGKVVFKHMLKRDIIKQLECSTHAFEAAVFYGHFLNRQYRVEMIKEEPKRLNDLRIIEIINGGGTYEDVAKEFNMTNKLGYVKQYCINRGYIYRDRGKLVLCDNPREHFSDHYRECPECGATFVCLNPDEWVYKFHGKLYHTWSCMRKAEKRSDESRKRSKRFSDLGLFDD